MSTQSIIVMKMNFEKKSTEKKNAKHAKIKKYISSRKDKNLQGKIRTTKKCDNFICNLQTNEP